MGILLPVTLVAQTDSDTEEDLTAVYAYVDSINQNTPIHVDEYSYTITYATFMPDSRFVQVLITLDQDADTTVFNDFDLLLDYFTKKSKWDIRALTDNNIDLRVNITKEYSSGTMLRPSAAVGYAHNFKAFDIRRYMDDATRLRARENLSRLAASLSRQLPVSTGDGEVFYACQFDTDSLMFYMVYEYPDERWASVKQYLSEQGKEVRNSKLEELANSDATNGHLGQNLYAAEVSITYVYLNHSHSESAEFTLAPALLDPYWEKKSQTMNGEQDTH